MPAFARAPRISVSTPELDRQEVEWWDAHASLIERIWGLPDPICRAARQGYITDVGNKFRKLCGPGALRVLEIACGTGWPGRLLASPSMKVTGIDFSNEQIQIARAKAAQTSQLHCDYLHLDVNQLNDSFQSGQFDGAFVHCGLHHLSRAELATFVEKLAQTPKGFPAILVEPVYLDKARIWGRLLAKASRRIYSSLLRMYLSGAAEDDEVTRSAEQLTALADSQGWFLSPKEVPFDVAEIHALFSRHFEITEIVPVTYFGLEAAQQLATLKDQTLAARKGERLLPMFTALDRALIRSRLLPKLTKGYLFCRIVLVRK